MLRVFSCFQQKNMQNHLDKGRKLRMIIYYKTVTNSYCFFLELLRRVCAAARKKRGIFRAAPGCKRRKAADLQHTSETAKQPKGCGAKLKGLSPRGGMAASYRNWIACEDHQPRFRRIFCFPECRRRPGGGRLIPGKNRKTEQVLI